MIDNEQDLSEEAKMVATTVTDIAEDYGHDYWRKCAANHEFPSELWETLGTAGFHGILIPEAYGGVGMGTKEMEILIKTFASHGISTRMFIVSSLMATLPIRHHGSTELKERFLPEIASGETMFCFALTEPEAGTNSYTISTTATRDGDEYVINGQKLWISGAADADYIQLVTRTTALDDVTDKTQGGTVLVVPTDADGVEMDRLDVDITESIGEYSVYFDDVRVPVANRIGKEGEGFHHIFDVLNPERIALNAKAIGYGNFVLDRAVEYANNREVFDGPIGGYQGLQHPLSEAKIDLEIADVANQKAIRRFENGREDAGIWANMANYASSEAADDAFDISLQVHGGNGLSRDYDIVSLQNNIRLLRIAPLNNEMLLNYVGEKVLGLPRSY